MTRWNDPDETEGRRIYRATAEAVARRDMALARHRPSFSAASASPLDAAHSPAAMDAGTGNRDSSQ